MGAAESTAEAATQQPPSSFSSNAPTSSLPPSIPPSSSLTSHPTPIPTPTPAAAAALQPTPAAATKPSPSFSPQKPPVSSSAPVSASYSSPAPPTDGNATAPPTQSGTVAPLIAFFSQPPAPPSAIHPPNNAAPHHSTPSNPVSSPQPSTPATNSSPIPTPVVVPDIPSAPIANTSAVVAPAVSPSSAVSSSPASSSVDELSYGEIAAMEEFILNEAKSHSEVYDHPVWYELVEWSAKFLPGDIVLAWEQHILAYQLLSISKLEKFKKRLDEKWAEKNAKKKKIAQLQAKLSSNISDDERSTVTNELIAAQSTPLSRFQYEIPFEFARQLLDLDKELGVVRHSYVPKRISEELFWYQYFDTVISSIQAHVISTQAKVKQHNIQHFNRM